VQVVWNDFSGNGLVISYLDPHLASSSSGCNDEL
jgi:hypothetical protein